MAYAAKYTISALSGAYAEKYAVVIKDAQRLDALLGQYAVGKGIEALAKHESEGRHFDAYACFMQLMKVLKFIAKDKPNVKFYTGIRRVSASGEENASVFKDKDADGDYELRALGREAVLIRNGESEAWDGERFAGSNGEYYATYASMKDVFFDDIRNLLNLCEESMAKNASIVLSIVSNDVAIPPPLFQL
ncbi:MAG: hypothetical protein WC966_01730 [Bradymonadales bacterium]